ncbi:cystatin domain-containing protein [Salmonella enterica]|nr:cystatin domain-containing protein [Salmonella enterica]MCQ7855557.1 cystatin domain-containing protein [Salmonella enterica]
MLRFADLALQDINKERKEGYVLSLNRVHDAREHRQEGMGSVFYLTLDVLETNCHVLSKKSWKDCNVRMFYESVYGQCKAIFYVNKPGRIIYSLAYNCTLRPVSQRKIHFTCPDCPSSGFELSDPNIVEAATESLAKFNSENPSKQYSLFKITKASGQYVFGPGYFVEYLIKESPCTESKAGSCSLQPSDAMPVGLCVGSLSRRHLEKFVSATCHFFQSQDPVPGGANAAVHQKPTKGEEASQKSTAPTSAPSKTVPRGSIQYLPDLDKSQTLEPQTPTEIDPQEAFPVQLDLTTDPKGEGIDVSFLFMWPMEEKLVVFPFPGREQASAKCPGPAQTANNLVLPP